MKKTIVAFYKLLIKDSLYRNSLFLILSMGVMAFLGFLFWVINARLYSPEQVGIGTTLISIMTLISSFSLLGLNNGLVKYLPVSEIKNRMINTSYALVATISILISVIYLVFLNTFSPKLSFVRENIVFCLLFILFVVFTSLNSISEVVFIAYRSTKFVLIKNTVSSIAKTILPVLLVALGAYGIFISMGISIAIAYLIGLVFLILRFNYLPRPVIDKNVVKVMTKFSLANYIAGFIGGVPTMLLPVLITNFIGAKFSAYFYMDMMIASFLYVIPQATSQSFFAEASYNESELRLYFKKAIKIISIITIPLIIITFFLGNYILLAFGKEYSFEGLILLRFLSISGIFVSINSLGGAILNIKYKIKSIILLNLVTSIIIISLSIILIKIYSAGIVGVGIAWITGQATTALFYLFLTKKLLK